MSIIQIENLSKFYGKKQALKNINLSLGMGEIVGIFGPNGSGKTTLLKLIVGLLKPSSGNIKVKDEPISEKSKNYISFLPDRNILPLWMKVLDAKNFYKDFYRDFNEEKFNDLIKFFNISEKAKIKSLSKGESERLLLSLVLSRNSDIYLLDEPLSGIDPSTREKIIKSIIRNYKENSLMIIATHLVREVENVVDRTIFLNQGEIVLNEKTDELKAKRNKSIEDLFKEIFQ